MSDELPDERGPEEPGDQTIGLSRRRFLILGSGATALLAAAYASVRQVGCYPEPPDEYDVLNPKEVAVLSLLGDFLIPRGGELPGSAGDVATLRRIDRLLAGVPPFKRRLLRALPLVYEHGSSLDRFGARSMTRLPPWRLEEYLSEWIDTGSVIRMQLWSALKVLYSMTYFERPDVLRAMDMPVLCGGGEEG